MVNRNKREVSYYDLLGVNKDVDASTLKRAWHKLSMKYHPDRLSEEQKLQLGDKMKEINEAYDVLSDPKKRAIYDKFGKEALSERMGDNVEFQQQRNDIVPPIQVAFQADLETLYLGKTVSVTFKRNSLCTECDMTGTKDKIRKPCQGCKGAGHVMGQIRRGPFVQQGPVPCDKCKGKGLQPGTVLCPICKGTTYKQETFTAMCDIPPGSNRDDVIEIEAQGHEIPPKLYSRFRQRHSIEEGKTPRGAVLVIIQELQHPLFKRTNTGEADLAINIELSLAEALCGFSRSVRHLDGRILSIIGTDPINHGDIKVIKHEGMPRKSNPMMHGNLLVKFSVKLPSEFDRQTVYHSLTGESLDDVDFSVPSDHVMTHLCSLSEIDTEEEDDQQRPQAVSCPVQ